MNSIVHVFLTSVFCSGPTLGPAGVAGMAGSGLGGSKVIDDLQISFGRDEASEDLVKGSTVVQIMGLSLGASAAARAATLS